MLSTCVEFSNYVEGLHLDNPSSEARPWRLILYSDEVTPGNQLKVDNKRKIQAIYWSLHEFHPKLSDEDMWFTFTTKRSSEVNLIDGGMSRIFGFVVKLMFVTLGMSLTGQVLKLASGKTIRLFLKLETFLQDGGAHKLTWHIKGDSGVRFCLLCKGLVSMASELAGADPDGDFVSNVNSWEELNLASSEELKNDAARVKYLYDIKHAVRSYPCLS